MSAESRATGPWFNLPMRTLMPLFLGMVWTMPLGCRQILPSQLLGVVGKRALFRGKGALFGVVHTKNHGHYFEVALFWLALFEVLL